MHAKINPRRLSLGKRKDHQAISRNSCLTILLRVKKQSSMDSAKPICADLACVPVHFALLVVYHQQRKIKCQLFTLGKGSEKKSVGRGQES